MTSNTSKNQERQYRCAKCGGKVQSNHKDNGLGTWHCEKGCNPTKVKVTLKRQREIEEAAASVA